jgi:large conductance mechanosensitive channel
MGQSFASVAEAEAAGAPIIKYGIFINTVLDFVIVAFAIFLLIRGLNKMRRKQEAAPTPPPGPTPDQKLLAEIRDLLRTQTR